MRFILPLEKLKEIEEKGYKRFYVARRKGKSVDFCHEEHNVCINIGSARTFGLGGKGFCLNTTRKSYPYSPSTAVCFDSREEALSYAVVLMETVERTGSRYVPDEVKADIMKEFMREGEGYVCRSDESIPLDLAVAREFGMNESKRTKICTELSLRILKRR